MDAKIKPKSIRKAILLALADGAIVTIDDLQTKVDEPRTKVANNAHAALAEFLVKRLRDDVTGNPAYQITAKGREYLAKFSGEEPQEVTETAGITSDAKKASAEAAVVEESLTTEFGNILRENYEAKVVAFPEMMGIKGALEAKDENAFLKEKNTILRDQRADLTEAFNQNIDRLEAWQTVARTFGCTTPDEISDKIRSLQQIELMLRNSSAEALASEDSIEMLLANVLHATAHQSGPVGFVVQRPIKPMLRFTKPEKAQAYALNLARLGQRVRVFALHPVGNAVPGAEWVPA